MANSEPNLGNLTPFQPGQSGNPGGKTSEQRKAEVAAAEIAASLRLKALQAMAERIESGELDALEIVTGDNLRLFKDSEDRAHGTPKAAVDHTSSDGSMTPRALDASKLSDAALAELHAAMNAAPDTDAG